MARLFARMGYKVGAEIGTGGGSYAAKLCEAIPSLKLYCIDLWKPYDGYFDYTDTTQLARDHDQAVELLQPYNAEFIGKFSMDALRGIGDNSLDFVYIDANHLSPWIDNDVYWWSKKVRPGGIVSGHDYMSGHADVMRAVEYFTAYNHIYPWFIVGKPEEQGAADLIPSWFWVKQGELIR
jgi:predicted O-methyltransferase YrrM